MTSSVPIISMVLSANTLKEDVWKAWENDPENANIIYAYALKAAIAECSSSADKPKKSNIFFVCRTSGNVDFVLACMDGPLGPYPVFIYTSPSVSLDTIRSGFESLVTMMIDQRLQKRVFAVFSAEAITKCFVQVWTDRTGIKPVEKPYYEALLSTCEKPQDQEPKTKTPDGKKPASHNIRPATEKDIETVGRLCEIFAKDSAPYTLDDTRAAQEATYLVKESKLWILEANVDGDSPQIACIVAVTRDTPSVSAITKVFTDPDWQQRGYAALLVHRVCKELLSIEKKKSIVLYVGHKLEYARKVYSKVGFNDVSRWLEVGFDREKVTLGYW
ncbi:hypothetical protein BDN72DRAFT_808121 [Pluteus cervinus]|uniref:Uncharacterized protein n=1 Tax=Pluteus cervinus TaxID=181527 RepID=A0ACD3BHJ7_9AGAR|nr:hypothetical protein BDN72DRAFT_808121 [Pluteus cervinus]